MKSASFRNAFISDTTVDNPCVFCSRQNTWIRSLESFYKGGSFENEYTETKREPIL